MVKAGPKNTAVVLNLDDPDELTRRRPISSFLSLEAEFADLCRDEHQTTKAAAAKAEAQIAKAEARIKAICNLAKSADSRFSERFIRLLRNRWRSSAAWGEYVIERNRLLLWLRKAFPAAEERRRQRTIFTSTRDKQMAEEFRQKRNSPAYKYKSASDLKTEIGERHGIKRSAAIAAINRGLKSLKA